MVPNIADLRKEFKALDAEFSNLVVNLKGMSSVEIRDLQSIRQGAVAKVLGNTGFGKKFIGNLFQRYQTAKEPEVIAYVEGLSENLKQVCAWMDKFVAGRNVEDLQEFFSSNPDDVNSVKYFDKLVSDLTDRIIDLGKRLDYDFKVADTVVEGSSNLNLLATRIAEISGKIEKTKCPSPTVRSLYQGILLAKINQSLNENMDFDLIYRIVGSYWNFNIFVCTYVFPFITVKYTEDRNEAFFANLFGDMLEGIARGCKQNPGSYGGEVKTEFWFEQFFARAQNWVLKHDNHFKEDNLRNNLKVTRTGDRRKGIVNVLDDRMLFFMSGNVNFKPLNSRKTEIVAFKNLTIGDLAGVPLTIKPPL